MDHSNQHWLEKLFTPHFSEEDFFNGTHQPEPLICEKLALVRARKREGLCNMLMSKFQEEKTLGRKELPSKLIVREQDPSLKGTKINISKEETEGDPACWDAANLDVGSEERLAETEGLCIWTAKECAALRKEMHKEKLGSISLKLQLSFLKAELGKLKDQHTKLVAECEQTKQELSNSRKETLCKAVQLERIQRQSFQKDSETVSLKRELYEKSSSIRGLREELQQAREENLHLNLFWKDLQQQLEMLQNQRNFENELAVEKMKLLYETEIGKLQKELEDMRRELKTEKASSTKSTQQLQMLKKHFSVQPSSDPAENLSLYFI